MTDCDVRAAYLRKADRAPSSARLLLEAGDDEGAVNRAYYAMFAAASAALLAVRTDAAGVVAKTHRGLIAAFGKELVLPGHVAAELGRSLNVVEELRITADYVGRLQSLHEATWVVEQAQAFVTALRTKFPPT